MRFRGPRSRALALLLLGVSLTFAATAPSALATPHTAPSSTAEPSQTAASEVVLATFAGGEVLASDVWREVRYLSIDERRYRQVEGAPLAQQWRDWIHRVALRQIARLRAPELGVGNSPTERELARREARKWWLERWHPSCYGLPLVPPDDDELLPQVMAERKQWPARLRLSHIYLRAEGAEAVATAVTRLGEWRAELRTLEAFRARARESSDSQSAHKDGRLGWVQKGWLPAAVEEVLYTLPSGALSQPIPARGGVHLFWIEENEPARSEPLEPLLDRARQNARFLELKRCRQTRLAESGLAIVLGEGEWPSVTVGGWSLDGGLLRQLHTRGLTPGRQVAQRVGEDEALLQHALASHRLDADELDHLHDLEDNALLSALIEALRGGRAEGPPDEAALREIYDSRPNGYQTERLRQLRVLSGAPGEGQDPMVFLSSFEALAEDLAAGRLGWQQAAEGLPGATFEEWPALPPIAIASRTSPFLMRQIGDLEAGQVSEPIQDGETFYVVGVVSRQEPRRQSPDEVRPRLVREWQSRQQRQASARAAQQLLTEHLFEPTPAGLAFLADPPEPFATPIDDPVDQGGELQDPDHGPSAEGETDTDDQTL